MQVLVLDHLMDHFEGNARQNKKKPRATRPYKTCGGEEEDRTPDLRIANATLSQLSYPPDVT